MPTKIYNSSNLPAVTSATTDRDIPQRLWCHWQEAGQPRCLRRALTDDERAALEARAAELAPVLQGHGQHDLSRVRLALSDMIGGFAQRQDDATVSAKVDSQQRLLAEFPLWAIDRVCRRIRSDGYLRDGKVERRWPPSDPELFMMVRDVVQVYQHQLRSAAALLAATVDPDALKLAAPA